jgi:hypothetical protein
MDLAEPVGLVLLPQRAMPEETEPNGLHPMDREGAAAD